MLSWTSGFRNNEYGRHNHLRTSRKRPYDPEETAVAGNGAAPVVASRGFADYTGTGSAMQSPPLLSETLTHRGHGDVTSC